MFLKLQEEDYLIRRLELLIMQGKLEEKLSFSSPEVWRDQPYDIKSDIWSLGCVFYEMITLRPPFRAEDMASLYKKVLKGNEIIILIRKGAYPKIPAHFSQDMANMVKSLLQVSAHLRPNCGKFYSLLSKTLEKILRMPQVIKRIDKLFGSSFGGDDGSILLNTIRIPRNLLYLTDRLPKPTYEDDEASRRNTSDGSHYKLPSIKKRKVINISKGKYAYAPKIKNIDGILPDPETNKNQLKYYKYNKQRILEAKSHGKKSSILPKSIIEEDSPLKSPGRAGVDHSQEDEPIPSPNSKNKSKGEAIAPVKKKYWSKSKPSLGVGKTRKKSSNKVGIRDSSEPEHINLSLKSKIIPKQHVGTLGIDLINATSSLNQPSHPSHHSNHPNHINRPNLNANANIPSTHLLHPKKNKPLGSDIPDYPNLLTNDSYINQIVNKPNPPISSTKSHQYHNLQRIANIYSQSPLPHK